MKQSYGWVIVAAGALMTCVAIGAMFSLAVYLTPMAATTGWSRAGISSAMSIDFLAMGLAGFAWGAISDRFGPRIVVLSGAVLLGLGQVLASRAGSLIQFQLTYGIVVGHRRRRFLRAADGDGHDLVREEPRARRLAGLGRHGRGADDGIAVRALADLRL